MPTYLTKPNFVSCEFTILMLNMKQNTIHRLTGINIKVMVIINLYGREWGVFSLYRPYHG